MSQVIESPIAVRTTADGQTVKLWRNGELTGGLGFALPGVPMACPRSEEGRARALSAGWLFMGEVELYEVEELGRLYECAKRVAKRDGTPGDLRRIFAEKPRPKPIWETLRADSKGRPTERVWRIPRMLLPGVAVWDHVSSSRGRYEIVNVDREGVAKTTGIRFATMAEVLKHLF